MRLHAVMAIGCFILLCFGASSCALHQTVKYTPEQIRDLSVPVDLKGVPGHKLTWPQQKALAERAKKIAYYNNPDNCREALSRNPNDPDAHERLGMIALSKNPAEAVDHLRATVRLRPNNRHAALMLGIALKRTGRKDEAAGIWKRLAQQQDGAGKAAQRALKALKALKKL